MKAGNTRVPLLYLNLRQVSPYSPLQNLQGRGSAAGWVARHQHNLKLFIVQDNGYKPQRSRKTHCLGPTKDNICPLN